MCGSGREEGGGGWWGWGFLWRKGGKEGGRDKGGWERGSEGVGEKRLGRGGDDI